MFVDVVGTADWQRTRYNDNGFINSPRRSLNLFIINISSYFIKNLAPKESSLNNNVEIERNELITWLRLL